MLLVILRNLLDNGSRSSLYLLYGSSLVEVDGLLGSNVDSLRLSNIELLLQLY